jgi:hypothetical protein
MIESLHTGRSVLTGSRYERRLATVRGLAAIA